MFAWQRKALTSDKITLINKETPMYTAIDRFEIVVIIFPWSFSIREIRLIENPTYVKLDTGDEVRLL